MKSTTSDWVSKAEGHFNQMTAEAQYTATENRNYANIRFFAGQCAEKYIRAKLWEAGRASMALDNKIHNIAVLLDEVVDVEDVEPECEASREDLVFLCRYLSESADEKSALDAQRRCCRFRTAARKALGLEI